MSGQNRLLQHPLLIENVAVPSNACTKLAISFPRDDFPHNFFHFQDRACSSCMLIKTEMSYQTHGTAVFLGLKKILRWSLFLTTLVWVLLPPRGSLTFPICSVRPWLFLFDHLPCLNSVNWNHCHLCVCVCVCVCRRAWGLTAPIPVTATPSNWEIEVTSPPEALAFRQQSLSQSSGLETWQRRTERGNERDRNLI